MAVVERWPAVSGASSRLYNKPNLVINDRFPCNPHSKSNRFLNFFGCQKGLFKTGFASFKIHTRKTQQPSPSSLN